MSPHDRWRLKHVAEALEAAEQSSRGRHRAELKSNRMLVFALTRAVEIAGEAASKISDAGRAELPSLPWPQMTGMRNRLVHAYFDVDLDILWETVTVALPPLLAVLKASQHMQPP